MSASLALVNTSTDTNIGDLLADAEIFVDGDWVESKDQDPNGDVRLIQLADIGDGCYLNKSSRFLTSEKARELRCTFLRAGDILVARMPEPLGRACIFPGDAKRAVTVVDVCIIRFDERNLNARWLVHAINSPMIRQRIAEYVTGTTRQRISRGNLAKIKLSAPSLEEQRRIAAMLDKIEGLRAKRREAIIKLDHLLQSVFLEMFGDPVINPRKWPMAQLAELGDWSSGGTPSRANTKNFEGEIPWYSSGELNSVYVADSLECISKDALANSAAKVMEPGSLMIGMYDTAAFKSSITTIPAACNQAIAFSYLSADKCESLYVYQALQLGKEHFKRMQRGVRQKNLNLTLVRETSIPLPPLKDQIEFSHIFRSIQAQKQANKNAELISDALFESLQHQVFSGMN